MIDKNREKYWENILGKSILQSVDWSLQEAMYETTNDETCLCEMYEIWNSKIQRSAWTGEIECFDNFYRWFLYIGEVYAQEKYFYLCKMCRKSEDVLARNIYSAIKEIPVRCLIKDILLSKDMNLLVGENAYEEYEFYDRQLLGNIEYVRKLCDECYPEMLRLILLRTIWTVRFLGEIVNKMAHDKEKIIQVLCGGKSFQKIENIECGLSDSHKEGKTVSKITLDNGSKIMYKPRSMRKEEVYQKVYSWVCKQNHIEVMNVKMLHCGEYGWEQMVRKAPCCSEAQVRRFYYRLGMQLCLCYLFDGSDLHGENLIACGEFPVIVDLETLVGDTEEFTGEGVQKRNRDEQMASECLKHSVLKTGILPLPIWETEQNYAIVSALHKGGKIRTPFKMPVIHNRHTSDVEITYECIEFELSDSVPCLYDVIANLN